MRNVRNTVLLLEYVILVPSSYVHVYYGLIFVWDRLLNGKVKSTHDIPTWAQKGRGAIYPTHSQPGPPAPQSGRFTLRKKPVPIAGSWVGLVVGLNGCLKSRRHSDSTLRPSFP